VKNNSQFGRNAIEFLLNGRPVIAEGFSPQTTLLDFIRSRGLTGAKEGCAEGECGACTVVMVKDRNGATTYVPLNSCLVFLPMAAGEEIYTIEALATNGKLAEAQQAMVAMGGSQCGYCTPGFVMSLFAEQYRPGRTSLCDPHCMAGNLCRCTGYRPIRDAALSLGPPPAGPLRDRLAQPAPRTNPVECEGFHRPTKLKDCLALLDAEPGARVVAGATDLAVESNLRARDLGILVSVEALPELREWRDGDDEIVIGAALALSEIGECWPSAPPFFHEWLDLFASPLIRNGATLGGNLATASPIGDAAPLLLALDARLRLVSARGERIVALDSFFTGYRQTCLGAGELIAAIHLTKPLPSYVHFFKAAKRRLDDISTVAACFAMDLDSAGRIDSIRLAYGGVAATPVRARRAERAITGMPWGERAVEEASQAVRATLRPISDHRGSAEYRLAVAQTLLEQFWVEQQETAVA